jgi:hypothetical protein
MLSKVTKVSETFSDLIPPINDGEGDLFRDQSLADDPNTPDKDSTVAVIGDSRNDENLIVA